MLTRERRAHLLVTIERRTEVPLLILVFAMIAALVAPFVMTLRDSTVRMLDAFDVIVWAIFVLDIVVRTALAQQRLAYLRKNWIDVLVVAVPMFRVLRIFRLLRFVRILVFFGKFAHEIRQFLARRRLNVFILVVATFILLGTVLIYGVDREYEGGSASLADAFWLAIVNAFSAGYANTYPVAPEAKAVSILLIILGTALVSYFTASLASYFTEKDQDVEQERIEKKLDELIALVKEKNRQ